MPFQIESGNSTDLVAVKPASTAALATDPAMVFTASPNSAPLPISFSNASPATQTVNAQDTASTTTVGADGQNLITGSPTSGSAASFSLSNVESAEIQVSGTWTGTLTVEKSIDSGTTWVIAATHLPGTSYTAGNFTANFIGGSNVAGATNIRLRATAAWTGTATVRLVASSNAQSLYIINPLTLRDASTQSISNTIKAASTPAVATDTAFVVAISPNNIIPTVGDYQTTGAVVLGALNAQAALQVKDSSFMQFQIASTTGSFGLKVEASMDSTNGTNGTWEALNCQPVIVTNIFNATNFATLPWSPFDSSPENGQYFANCGGFAWVRLLVNSYTSGSCSVNMVVTPGSRPATTSINPTFITSPLAWGPGGGASYATTTPYQTLRTTEDPSLIFYDNFIGQILDTNFRWNTVTATGVGASIALNSTGGLTITSGTAANSNAELSSQASFQTFGSTYQYLTFIIQIETPIITGLHRFWGLGVKKTTGYTDLAPIQDGIGFEVDYLGNLKAVIYANGSNTFSQTITVNTETGSPAGYNDGGYHYYIIYYKTGSSAFFYVDNIEVEVAQASLGAGNTMPSFTGLPVYFHAVNGSSVLSGATTFNTSQVALSDFAGNQAPSTITGPQVSDQSPPFAATVFAPGELRVQDEPRPVFVETYENPTLLDTVNRWQVPQVAGGAPAVYVGAGTLTIGTGTTANGYTLVQSQASFQNVAPGWLEVIHNLIIESPVATNAYRFWGLGALLAGSVPTATAPLYNGVGFEITTAGKLMAVIYAGGTRNAIQDLSSATGNNRQPSNASLHSYTVFFRDDKIYWAIDNPDNVVATVSTGAFGPNACTLPLMMLTVAGSTPPVSNVQLVSESVFIADTTGSSMGISDGLYPWRKATVKAPSTATTATDMPLVMALHPSTPLPTVGNSNYLGTVLLGDAGQPNIAGEILQELRRHTVLLRLMLSQLDSSQARPPSNDDLDNLSINDT